MEASTNPVAVVTGASRGAGKGIAVALGRHGYTVYVTGRSRQEGDAPLPGTVYATAEAVTEAGGRGVACVVNHAQDEEVAALFAQVEREEGRLDILVNNATAIDDDITKRAPFWEKSVGIGNLLDVGLRSAFIAGYYAAPLMVRGRQGLMVNTSSFGACCYMHDPAYGAQKAGLDKMAWDMAVDLRPYDVAAVSVWMGPLATDRTRRVWERDPDLYQDFAGVAETPEFVGEVIHALNRDPKRMERSGHTWIVAELAREYDIRDEGGKEPPSYREALGAPLPFSDVVVA